MTESDFLTSQTPLSILEQWLSDANSLSIREPMAMTLATVSLEKNVPSQRVVLLKEVQDQSLVFYTNYNSRKGREIESNPKASFCMYWNDLYRQVSGWGDVKKMDAESSDSYWETRNRSSKVSQYISQQSDIVKDRYTLEAEYNNSSNEFGTKAIPRPKYWGGFLLEVNQIEFWVGKDNRLHDRFQFVRLEANWNVNRLYP